MAFGNNPSFGKWSEESDFSHVAPERTSVRFPDAGPFRPFLRVNIKDGVVFDDYDGMMRRMSERGMQRGEA